MLISNNEDEKLLYWKTKIKKDQKANQLKIEISNKIPWTAILRHYLKRIKSQIWYLGLTSNIIIARLVRKHFKEKKKKEVSWSVKKRKIKIEKGRFLKTIRIKIDK